ncbi:hypothetical protein ECC02_001330 [Trypanosoma cruzi]|uniref:Sfi1 spindle body domain-containing protein n=1 Tax=Trypanosoma cruzi TaxID=5693 RepID=A0A7J6YGL9_TRYCR|nr:hypothetical protein ECC02_001330 [Trypanosoma cruzi]
MDGGLKELQDRLNEAEERLKRMTHLMLRAVWQYVTQQHSSPMVTKGSSVGTAAGGAPCLKVVVSNHHAFRPRKVGGTAMVQHVKGGSGGVDQARLSRELYRKAFGEARQQTELGIVPAKNLEEDSGGDAIPSVALLLLQSSRERAIMSVFLLRLRLAVHRRRFLHEECELRYAYYRLRRVLRAWCDFVRDLKSSRQRLLCDVLAHWVKVVERRRQTQECLHRFLVGLSRRRHAFECVRRMKLQQYFLSWRQRLDVRRTLGCMEERAAEMRRRHKYVEVGSVAQPAGVFVIKDRVFSHWKKKTEHRLDNRLAEWMSKRFVMRRVWRELVARYLFSRQQHTEYSFTSEYGPPTVYVDSQIAEKFMELKAQCAQQIARGRLRKIAFIQWRAKYRNRLSDRFFVFRRRVRVMEAWVEALRRRRVNWFVITACWCRWRERLYLRLQYLEAQCWRRQRLQRNALLLWRNNAACRLFDRHQTLHSCCFKWWQRAKLKWARRRLAAGKKRRVIFGWRDVAMREKEQRTMTCVAETLRELVVLVGCFRRWKERYEHACCARLSQSILSELRREKQRARLFQRWKRLTFWPHAVCKDPSLSS